jgi:methyl-CpG-binding domain protein 4
VLLQERFKSEPWKMMVACILLNRTTREQVDRVIDSLFDRYPTASAMETADVTELSEVLRPLGLHNRRAASLKKFSKDWLAGVELSKMFGVGKYAEDSWEIFQNGNEDVEPEDRVLREFVRGSDHGSQR